MIIIFGVKVLAYCSSELPIWCSLMKNISFQLLYVYTRHWKFQALLAPAKAIASNAGVDGTVVVDKVKASDWQMGYNALTGKYENLLAAGVIDPCQVSRHALQNAVSVAGLLLTTQAMLVEKTKKPKALIPQIPGISPWC